MADWITLQEAAKKVGVKKGTLSMWRNRNKFPFETQGTGKNLQIASDSVDKWLSENPGKVKTGKKRGPKPGSKAGGAKRGRKPATALKAAKSLAGIAPEIAVNGALNLETVQNFVTDIQNGATVQIVPTKDGFVLSTLK
ncbi:MAG: helix-turn-helix domain-containing protein [Planctomycetota bacterium]